MTVVTRFEKSYRSVCRFSIWLNHDWNMMRITIQFTGWAVTKILKLVGGGGGWEAWKN